MSFFIQKSATSLKIPIKANVGATLSKVLNDHKIPLEFECGFSCECGTCAIKFETPENYNEISKEQPLQTDEKLTIKSNNVPDG